MDQDKYSNKTLLSIVPAPLIPPVTKGQKHTYGLLDALGNITKVISITDTKSTTAGHSFELRPLIVHKLKKYLAFGNYKLINRIVSRVKPDAILLEQPYMGFITNLVSKQNKIPYAVHAHNLEFLKQKTLGKWWWPIVFWIERHAYKNANAVFFISEVDRVLAIRKLLIPMNKCFVSPYGVPQTEALQASDDKIAKIKHQHGINKSDTVFLFFGDMKYLQNIEAFEIICKEILPRLREKNVSDYKILVCGAGLSESYQKQLRKQDAHEIIYAGYVHDIDEYLQIADILINPIQHRGGIQTKVIHSLGFNTPVVSTHVGALGINKKVCGKSLQVVSNRNWDAFVDKMCYLKENKANIPDTFFKAYNWNAIAFNLLKQILH